MSNVTSLARVPQAQAIEPANLAELRTLACDAAKSGFFGAKSPEQAILLMMTGRDLGLTYPQSLRAFHVIEGKPTLSADGMVAVCLVRRDVCEYFRTVESTNERATVVTKRVGAPGEQRYSFSMADAQRAGVASKGTWGKYPSRMLLARARAALARDVYPDLLLGLYDPDEVEVLPAPAPPPAPATPPAATITVAAVVPSDGEVEVKSSVVDLRASFIAALDAADVREDVRRIGLAIRKSSLSAEERASLQPAYVEAMTRVTSPAAKSEQPPPDEDAERAEAEAAERHFADREGATP